MIDDHLAAALLAFGALVMLAWGIRRHLRFEARRDAMRRHPSTRATGPDFTSEAARRYHESNQYGR